MPSAHVVVDLGFGDSGKGALVDHLVREHDADGVVLFNGGAQRAHNVVSTKGHHTFSQFSSGTLAGAPTFHSQFSLVNPIMIFEEMDRLKKLVPNLPARLGDWVAVHADAVITTPFHMAANRLRELARGENRHGSCGLGIGETIMDEQQGIALYARDLHNPLLVKTKLKQIQRHKNHEIVEYLGSQPQKIAGFDWNHPEAQRLINPQQVNDIAEIYRIFAKLIPLFEGFDFSEGTWVFEGSQGVLLDEYNGFHPHTTWSKTGLENPAQILVGKMDEDDIATYGVMRSYMTRHGAGPFVTEDPDLNERFPEAHNGHGEWQGSWRVGWTDFVMLDYALAAAPVDQIVVTHMDRVDGDWKIAAGYEGLGDETVLMPPQRDMPRDLWEQRAAFVLGTLKGVKPEYAAFGNMDPDTLVELIVARTQTPVTKTFHGPSHEDVRSLTAR